MNTFSSSSAPAPTEHPHGNARVAFFYLVSFFLLYIMVPSIGTILFQIINKVVPDPAASSYEGYVSTIESITRGAIAALIITAPLYFASMWFIQRELRQGRIPLQAGVRRWLTYLSLFVAAAIVVVDLIVVINRFLEGEIGGRFMLKALTVLMLAGYVFAYYFWDIRRDDRKTTPLTWVFSGVALSVVLFVLVAGFTMASSPGQARLYRIDERRVASLRNLTSAVDEYAEKNRKLPETIEEALAPGVVADEADLHDPVTQELYEYHVTGSDTYEICATFSVSNRDRIQSYEREWAHGEGRTCFSQIAHPLRSSPSPLFNKPIPVPRDIAP